MARMHETLTSTDSDNEKRICLPLLWMTEDRLEYDDCANTVRR